MPLCFFNSVRLGLVCKWGDNVPSSNIAFPNYRDRFCLISSNITGPSFTMLEMDRSKLSSLSRPPSRPIVWHGWDSQDVRGGQSGLESAFLRLGGWTYGRVAQKSHLVGYRDTQMHGSVKKVKWRVCQLIQWLAGSRRVLTFVDTVTCIRRVAAC